MYIKGNVYIRNYHLECIW